MLDHQQSTNGSDDPDFVDIVLGEGNATDDALLGFSQLGTDPDIQFEQIRLRIGRRPTIRKLRDLYAALRHPYPEELGLFEEYEVWLFCFHVHLMKDGGFKSVRQLGCQVKYPEGYAVSIISQLPDSEYITKVAGKAAASATLTATGEAKVPLSGGTVGGLSAQVGAEITAKAEANGEINLSFSVMTDRVIATGTGDHVGEWSIKRGDEPLLGGQQFVHAVLIPKAKKEEKKRLQLELRAYVAVGTPFFVPARLTSEAVKLVVSLESGGEVATDA